MRRPFRTAAFLVFLLATAINGQQATDNISAKNLSDIAVINSTEFSAEAGNSQFLTTDDDADQIANSEPVEKRISVDDLALFPAIISKAILHPPFADEPTVLRL
jgi:hypothetical protein